MLCLVGGPGSALDIAGNPFVHRLCEDAYSQGKIIGALCYAVGCLVWARDNDTMHKSIIHGKEIVAHPREWDFTGDLPYTLYNATPENNGTEIVTQGFVFPLQVIVEDAVGASGKVFSNPGANRENPQVHYDHPFVTGLSVESCIAFGDLMVKAVG